MTYISHGTTSVVPQDNGSGSPAVVGGLHAKRRPSRKSTYQKHTLTALERDGVQGLAKSIGADPHGDKELYSRQAAKLTRQVPETLWAVLRQIARTGGLAGATKLAGLPRGSEAAAQAIFNHVLGEMVGYEALAGGRLFVEAQPRALMSDGGCGDPAGGAGDEATHSLELRCEQAFSELRPDWAVLTHVGGGDVEVPVLDAATLTEALAPSEAAGLRESLWMSGVPRPFRLASDRFATGELRGPFPILDGPEDDPMVRFDPDLWWGISPLAQELQKRASWACERLSKRIELQLGESLVIDNRRCLHGTPLVAEASRGGEAATLLRSFVVRDLAASRSGRPGDGRVIAASAS